MKTALFSDIHANLHALDACLEHARQQGARQFALLGDLIGYGAQPAAVLERVMALVAQGALCVRGNHDAAVLAPPAVVRNMGDYGAHWTAPFLNDEHRFFLAGLPLQARLGNHALLVHASADAPQRWPYITEPQAAARCMAAATKAHDGLHLVFCGHVHEQVLYCSARPSGQMRRVLPLPNIPINLSADQYGVAIVGSCGQPRDGDTRAMYALWDEAAAQLTFYRVRYDHQAAAAAVRAAGLPELFASRLESGR